MSESTPPPFALRLREAVWPTRELEAASAIDPATRSRVATLLAAAERRVSAASELAGEPSLAVAAALARDAAAFALDALAARRGLAAAQPRAALVDAFADDLARAGVSRDELAAARAALADDDALRFDRADAPDVERERVALVLVADHAGDAARVPTVAGVRRKRALRVAVLALAALVALGSLARLAFAPKNLARHKPATASSRHPAATTGPEGVTDGSTSAAYGVHTDREASPWVRVDLLAPYALDRVVVANRADGWFDDSLPLVLELSDDGVTFSEVARRTEHFGADSPWVAELGGRRGRYVRVRHVGTGLVVLGEIEAYGKAAR